MVNQKIELLWLDNKKKAISCDETNKVLNENFLEVSNILQSAFDDAILMGCHDDDFKDKVKNLAENLRFSLGKK